MTAIFAAGSGVRTNSGAIGQLLYGDAADPLVAGGAPRPAVLAATNRRHRASNTLRFIWPPQVRWYYAHTIRPKGGDSPWRRCYRRCRLPGGLTEARRAERKVLFSTISGLSLRKGLSAPRFALRSRRR